MFANPEQNIERFGLMPGMHVADFGAGSGFYTLAAAKVVGSSGRIYAVDIQKDLLAKIKSEGTRQKLYNIEIIWGDLERLGGTHLRDAAVDAVIASNILFQVQYKDVFIKEIKRVLKLSGKVFLVDWAGSFGGTGPRPEDVVPYDKAKELFTKEGFVFERTISAGAHHYGAVFNINRANKS